VKTNPNKPNQACPERSRMEPISFSPQHCWGLKGYLKKQSQFSERQNDTMLVITMVYGDFIGLRLRENKANSKPIKTNFDCSLWATTSALTYTIRM